MEIFVPPETRLVCDSKSIWQVHVRFASESCREKYQADVLNGSVSMETLQKIVCAVLGTDRYIGSVDCGSYLVKIGTERTLISHNRPRETTMASMR